MPKSWKMLKNPKMPKMAKNSRSAKMPKNELSWKKAKNGLFQEMAQNGQKPQNPKMAYFGGYPKNGDFCDYEVRHPRKAQSDLLK